ncbi:uncharacterized protein LOC121426783 [Lytechinus variegatus]|uniref:uncharacterized protein LOC121426783 n=1 Tax=Lytechinus variegatus TaxID=7654 RepID=UPI001BB1C9A2|nr:uncharacterized protein LOC121426783 [Lytechinus variegatus]
MKNMFSVQGMAFDNFKELQNRTTSKTCYRWGKMTIALAISLLLLQFAVACNSTTECCHDNEHGIQEPVTVETEVNTGTSDALLVTERSRFFKRLNFTRRITFPNFTQYGEDLPPLGDPEDIADLAKQNEGLPDECRSDLCPRQNITDLKGTFEWDYTPAGEYAFLPCPNGGWLEEYFPTAPPMMVAYRPCYPPTERKGLRQLFYEGAFWGEPVTEICRWSSETTWMLEDILKAIREEILDMIDNTPSNNYNSNNVTRVVYHLHEASLLLNSVPSHYLTEVDVLFVASMIDTSISAGVEGLYAVTSELGQEVVKLADRMLDLDIWTLLKAHTSCLSIADNLEIYTEHVIMGIFGDKLTHYGRNLYIEVEQTTPEYVDHLPNRWVVVPENEGNSAPEPVVSIEFQWGKIAAVKRRNQTDGRSHKIRDGDRDRRRNRTLFDDRFDRRDPGVYAVPSYKLRATAIVYYTGKFFVSELSQIAPVDDTVLVYIKAYADGVPVEEITEPLSITFYHTSDSQDDLPDWAEFACGSARLLSSREPVPDLVQHVELEWDSSHCTMNFTNENYTICMCTILDIIGLIKDELPTQEPTTPETAPGPLEFIGIPNSLGLTITSYIGYSISIISLLLTILTYAIFPKLRRGRPTLIHVNLCVAILLLLVLLISSVAFCSNVIGCRVANIFRIYTILVSLMWNGVEAVHMYMTLVKVFNSQASHFVLKAGLVAWGLPLFVVLVAAAVNTEIYDGVMINCTFSCRLSTAAFYCLFLTPMLIIVLFNSIVFGLVLRVIRKIYKTDGKKTLLNQLKGAVALLALLGISWIFGAAAAVNFQIVPSGYEPQATANTFQALFAISVAFQGFFIFIFHCARFSDVRHQWKTSLTPKRFRRQKRKSSCIPTVSTGSGIDGLQDTRL